MKKSVILSASLLLIGLSACAPARNRPQASSLPSPELSVPDSRKKSETTASPQTPSSPEEAAAEGTAEAPTAPVEACPPAVLGLIHQIDRLAKSYAQSGSSLEIAPLRAACHELLARLGTSSCRLDKHPLGGRVNFNVKSVASVCDVAERIDAGAE
ncbi:MAG: hypothetical protein KF802_04330 [Bdellovibrionaceae bacterium]|nr:hypothetical protein [Pseudobdellovibrionaceae bacterium]